MAVSDVIALLKQIIVLKMPKEFLFFLKAKSTYADIFENYRSLSEKELTRFPLSE